jgi:hypothetical protein
MANMNVDPSPSLSPEDESDDSPPPVYVERGKVVHQPILHAKKQASRQKYHPIPKELDGDRLEDMRHYRKQPTRGRRSPDLSYLSDYDYNFAADMRSTRKKATNVRRFPVPVDYEVISVEDSSEDSDGSEVDDDKSGALNQLNLNKPDKLDHRAMKIAKYQKRHHGQLEQEELEELEELYPPKKKRQPHGRPAKFQPFASRKGRSSHRVLKRERDFESDNEEEVDFTTSKRPRYDYR